MRWQEGRRSEHVEDRRGMRPAARAGGIGGLGLLLILGIALFTGVNPLALISMLGGGPVEAPAPQAPAGPGPGAPGAPARASADPQADFVSVILADTEDTWGQILREGGGDPPDASRRRRPPQPKS